MKQRKGKIVGAEKRLAVTLSGYITTLFTSPERGNDPTVEGPIIEGQYRRADAPVRSRLSTVECPYCREPMMESLNSPRRIARVLRRHRDGAVTAVMQEIPNTHRALGCKTCKVVFTQPRRSGADDGSAR